MRRPSSPPHPTAPSRATSPRAIGFGAASMSSSEDQRGTSQAEGTCREMPVNACTSRSGPPEQMPAHRTHPNSADCHFQMPAQYTEPDRTATSFRAETFYRNWTAVPLTERPLMAPRGAHAKALFDVLRDHSITIETGAEIIGVNVRQMRKYLEAEAPIPTTFDDALAEEKPEAASDFAARRRALRSGAAKTTADRFRSALAALERDGASPELVIEGVRRLSAITPPARGGR